MIGLRHFSIVIGIRIILIIVSVLVIVWLGSLQTNVVLIYILGGIFVIVQGSLLYKYVTNVNRKLTYFLESVRYSDFTINFRHDNKMGRTFQELNQQFNEVLDAFRQARA
jgi:two-component system nitrogen regulation sensor histidine kinase NtrY